MLPAVSKRRSEILAVTKLPVLEKNEHGELVLTGWSENQSGERLAQQVAEDCVVYAFRVISIAGARDAVMATKISKKERPRKVRRRGDGRRYQARPIDPIDDR
jgi:hypothetical protein